jgi:hypothetical protein
MRAALTCTLFSAAAASAAAAVPTPPVFPTEYSARLRSVAVDSSGGTQTSDCDIHFSEVHNTTSYLNCGQPLKPGMKGSAMQTVFAYGDDGPEGGNTGTVYYVFGYGPGGNTCNFWCDLQGSQQCSGGNSLCQYDYAKSAQYNGTRTSDGNKVDRFTWNDMLGPIAMNELFLDVDEKDDSTPVRMHRRLTPFGKYIGYFDTNYTQWRPSAEPASTFVVPGRASCSEGQNAQCANALRTAKAWGMI